MTATTTPSTMTSTNPGKPARDEPVDTSAVTGYAPEALVTLTGVSWDTYESLLADVGDVASPRFIYDRGVLEIMSPTLEHERDHRSLTVIVQTMALVWGIDVSDAGSVMIRRADLQRGFEADTSFYVQHVATMLGKTRIDPSVDPPPDLLIEMEVTTSAIAKLPLFAAMGIPEVWRVTSGQVVMFALRDGEYLAVPASVAFPPLTGDVLTRFVHEGRTTLSTRWLGDIQVWAKDHPHPGHGGDRDERQPEPA
ncbi:MAG: Uma2 family endonuclease [Chloroflexota bacterium]|nr:Uma2 family endonuclease [Chloroflexota bacterium]